MDAIERKIKRDRRNKYRLLRKFRQARDIAHKHTHRKYTSNFLRGQIDQNEYFWYASISKDDMAIAIYEWSEKERTMFH